MDGKLTVRSVAGQDIVLDSFGDVYIVGAGKACARMTTSLCKILGKRLTEGAITVPRNEKTDSLKAIPTVVKVTEGGHPIPDSFGVKGAKNITALLRRTKRDSLVFVLISGGGSALLPLPSPGLKLVDKQRVARSLLHSGATIQEINVVRKHLSAIKGGQLLRSVNGCKVVSLILSDVIDDDLSSIASGPTFPDHSTFADALTILRKYRISKDSDPVVYHLRRGARGLIPDTAKPGDELFKNVNNILIGTNTLACKGAVTYLRKRGIRTAYLGSRFSGEAKEFGSFLARVGEDVAKLHPGRFALVFGGETTVTIRGNPGLGGRNQEAALSCAASVPERMIAAFIGTDGIDGNSDAAGGLVSVVTRDIARRTRLNLSRHLDRHDSYRALKATKSSIFTGRTGTNVNDISILFCTG
jgi:glycerate-2-kinase